ncbi:MAG TPA: glutathione S-transferase family protein [Kofleriaceae bacterium]|nr:glutathione S-transferase family protein [Kofleriaceae bacterium]
MKLYHARLSSCSRRVMMTAHILGISFDEISIDLSRPDDRATLAKVNPNGKVPVLEDGELRLWESHAIMQYLCERTPEQTLYPRSPQARADVQRWLSWNNAHLAPWIGALSFERLWKKVLGRGGPDPAQTARYEELLHPALAVLDDHLAQRAWLSGDALTLADLSLAATFMYEQPAELPVGEYRNLAPWQARVHALDAWKRTDVALGR